jgi:NAD(P)-dependent dehydrogenase (short-subunit alcohol dehydrogenase family)
MNWTPDALGDLSGKNYFITGGNSGIGLEAAKILCGKGARVIIGARSEVRALAALEQVRAAHADALVYFVPLDLTDPQSITRAVACLVEEHPPLDALINNAGVMQTPQRQTAEGFELQLATNHLGHVRLTRQLLPHLESSGARIVVVSSIVHHQGRIQFDDLMFERAYSPNRVYSQSKLANLMFAFELDRRLQAAESSVICIPCHPGYSATNLQTSGIGMEGGNRLFRWIYPLSNRLLAQSAELGSYPLVLAAADPDAERGRYYGPTGLGDMFGPVGHSKVAKHARDTDVSARLWTATEELVGRFDVGPSKAH